MTPGSGGMNLDNRGCKLVGRHPGDRLILRHGTGASGLVWTVMLGRPPLSTVFYSIAALPTAPRARRRGARSGLGE